MYDESIENQLKIEEQPDQRIEGGQINETPGNLFDYENDYALAHWVSADTKFDVGLSKYFQARYSVRDEFRQAFAHAGSCVATNNSHIFNLVVKEHQYEIPHIENIKKSLQHMKDIAQERNIYKIALPRINVPCTAGSVEDANCCTWMDIKQELIQMYMATDFDIRIVYLDEYLRGSILDPDMEKINFGKDRKHIDGNLEHKYY